MKPPAYRITSSDEALSVQHRVTRPIGELWVLLPLYAFVFVLSGALKGVLEMLRNRDWPAAIVFVLSMGGFTLLSTWSWLIYSTGEFVHIDKKQFQLGRRRLWTNWRRKTFPLQSISQLRLTSRGGNKTRHYSVLTFRAAGKQNDVLENISQGDAIKVLNFCKQLGIDCVFPEVFPNYDGPMNADIQERGWFVNPWRPDQP